MPDGHRRRRGALLVPLLAGLVVAGAVGAGHAQERHADVVRFEGGEGVTFELDDGRRFVDALEVRSAPDGTAVLVNELSMDDYLSGLAEMPPRWPREALKAQAVAARTYAWRSVQRGTFEDRGYDICATVACQVFRGTEVVEEELLGERWREAVLETSGEVLLDDDGRPILARYFSTSGGRTLPNELVFPDSGSFEYLVGVDDPEDELSPLHRWRVEFTREEFDDVLSRGETLSAAVPVAEVERRGSLLDPGAEVVAIGEDGTEVAVPAVRFREFVSRVAAARHPERFPGRRTDGRTMPTTLPSSRFEVEVDADRVVVEGRGWGHGVGMSQYGAHGKARNGMAYGEILASYYNGLTPRVHEDVPDRVRVGLSVADDVGVRPDGPVRVLADGDEVAERALGGWRVVAGDGRLRLEPPEGRGQALDVSPTTLAAPPVGAEDLVMVEASVNKPVELALRVVDEHGERVLVRDLGVADPGEHAATWREVDAAGDRVPDGAYRLALVGTDEQGAEDGEPVEVAVTTEVERTPGGPGTLRLVGLAAVLVAVAAAVVGLVAILVRRRSSR